MKMGRKEKGLEDSQRVQPLGSCKWDREIAVWRGRVL